MSPRLSLGLAVLLGVCAPPAATALELGKLEVLSPLGQPFRAEVAVPQLSPAEASTLQLSISAPTPYQTPGVSYPSLDYGIQIELLRRQGGEPYLSLTSSQAIKEPLIGIAIDLKWRSGRLVRDYLMLLRTPEADDASVKADAAANNAATSAANSSSSAALSNPADHSEAPSATRHTLSTQAGDTAGNLAKKIKPPSASIEQALMALVQDNPAGFVDGNANRMRAGVILDLPDPAQILATSPTEAHQWLLAQNLAFDAYRSALADHALKHPAQGGLQLELQAPGRSASGSIQAKPPEAPPSEDLSDKLTLSQAQKGSQEAQMARDKQAQSQAERLAELQKNIGELKQLKTQPAANSGGATLPLAAPLSTAPVTPPAAAASVDARAAAVETAPKQTPAPPPTRLLWGAGAGLGLLALAGALWAAWLSRKSKLAPTATDESEAADLAELADAQSPHAQTTDPSLDADALPTDPVQRADQLIEAGQLDAAEIHLKTALRNQPTLLTAQAKLMEIYALRTLSSGLSGFKSLPLGTVTATATKPVNVKLKDDTEDDFDDADFALNTHTPSATDRPRAEIPPISLDLNDS